MRILIEKGRVIDPANNIDKKGNVYISNGKIVGLFRAPANFEADKVLNAKNRIVCPGLVDLAARLREPGLEHKATIKSETLAAVHGGITSLCCPPDTNPVIDTPAVVELIHQRSRQAKQANVYCLGAMIKNLDGQQLAEMFALKKAGCIGVSNGYAVIDEGETLRRCFEYAASCNMHVFLYAEDNSLRNNGVVHEGAVSTRLGLPAIPETAETVAVSRALLLMEQTGVRVHFCRLSTARAVTLIAEAKKQGLPVSADVNICQLHLTDMDIADYNSLCHLRPPLRSQRDQQALITGVKAGLIAAVCSDHQPHDTDAKAAPFTLTEPGASTIELLLPLLLLLVNRNKLDLITALSAVTHRPAEVMGINAGMLDIDRPANLCVFDPDCSWTIDNQALYSAGKNSPFNGWEVKGKVTHTIVSGKVVFEQK